MIQRIVASIVASLFLLGSIGTLAGCNTVHGIGQDVERGGEKIKDEANEHRK